MLTHQTVTELLARTDLFSGLQPAHLKALAKVTKMVVFESRTTVVRQGESGRELYILARGSVEVVREDPALGIEQVVGVLRAPEFFGEMSLLAGSPRSATIRTLEETTCVVLAATSYESLLAKLPVVAVQISRYLCQRLDTQMANMGFRFARPEELVYDPELYATFSEGLLRRHQAIPLHLDGPTLTVAMTRPHDGAAVGALRAELPGLGLQPVACAAEDYQAFVERYLSTAPDSRRVADAEPVDFTWADGRALPAPLGRILATVTEHGQIVVETQSNSLTLFSRPATGGLEPLALELEDWESKALRQLLAELMPQEPDNVLGRHTVQVGKRRGELRLARLKTQGGARYSLTLTDPRGAVPSPSYLWPTEALRSTVQAALTGGGAVVVTGAPRSGRSTTLYSLLAMLEGEGVRANAVALETESLVPLPGVAQVHLACDLGGHGLSQELDRCLKVALAQTPDVLMVDEPKLEDLGKLLEAADDGRTVLTTVKGSGDPLLTLTDAAPGRLENLRLLLGQQLLPRICPGCRSEVSPSPAVLAQLEKSGLGTRTDRYYRGAGCARCRGSGLSGRVANFQLLQLNAALADMLRSGCSADAVRKAAISNGLFFPFKSFARLLVLQGQIVPTEALRLYGGSGRDGLLT